MANDKTFDVFLSHDQRDAKLAAAIAEVFRSAGLTAFAPAERASSEEGGDAMWDAMAESRALVAVISDTEAIPPNTTFELGAAKAWNKPIYAIATGGSSAGLPAVLRGAHVYPPSRIEQVAQEIRRTSDELSDVERAILLEEFGRLGCSVDQLAFEPKQLGRLARQFEKRAKRHVAPEELVRLLLRLRKRGALRTAPGKRRTAS